MNPKWLEYLRRIEKGNTPLMFSYVLGPLEKRGYIRRTQNLHGYSYELTITGRLILNHLSEEDQVKRCCQ